LYTEKISIKGADLVLETESWAKQANGSIVLKWKKSVLLSAVTASKDPLEGTDFFPLTVEYREKYYASGQIPGGFFKREGKPSDKQVLAARVTDRPIRPLFPKGFKNEVQIYNLVLSSDGINPADVHAITASSAALLISNIPFNGPVAGVRVSLIDNEWVMFPDILEQAKAKINLAVAGTRDAVTMIEGSSREVSEETMVEAIKIAHAEIIRLCDMQLELQKKCGKEKMQVTVKEENQELVSFVRELAYSGVKEANSIRYKAERQNAIDAINASALEKVQEKYAAAEPAVYADVIKSAKKALEEIEVEIVREQIFQQGIRADGRKLDEIRDISIELNVLPGTHGSAVFTRGETQSLGVLTLGSERDVQVTDDIEGESESRFYLHYNFPSFSVGEVRRIMGPGRREIGHGKLAENALSAVIPDEKEFPYVIRLVSEILESNGSSSMATVCSGSLALMDGGVPIKNHVAGVAMGLIKEGDKFAVLTDIAGLEDHFGDMDFKVAGTKDGITAFQMDLKVQGVSYEIMEKALYQAKEGRLHILNKMNQALPEKRNTLKEHAPQIVTIHIEKDQIGELIGPGGKNIRSISETSGSEISVNDDGIVTIMSPDQSKSNVAMDMIERQFKKIEVGEIYEGIVKRIVDFGAFIELAPGKEGLCHISKISRKRIADVASVLQVNQKVKVKVLGVDRQGKISVSMRDTENDD